MSSVFNIGEVVGAFRPGEFIQHYYNQPLSAELGRSVGAVANTREANEATAKQYETDIDSALRTLRGLQPQDLATIGGLIQQGVGYDPMNNYRTLRTENLGALKGLSDTLGNVGRRQQNMSLAGLGYGGGRGSGYQDVLNQSRVNTAIAPIAQSIFSNLGAETASLDASRLNNLNSILANINQRAQVPFRGMDWRAAPIGVRNNVMGNYLQGLGSIGETSRANTAGFEYRDDKWAGALKAMDKSLNSALDTYLSMYGGGMMGGMGGMGGGGGAAGGGGGMAGLFGGGGGQAQAPAYQPYYPSPYQGYGGAPTIYSSPMGAMQGY